MEFAKITHTIFAKSYVQIAIQENPTHATREIMCTNRDFRKSYIRFPQNHMYKSRFKKILHTPPSKSYVEIAIPENPTYATLEIICTNRDFRKSYTRHPAGSTFFEDILILSRDSSQSFGFFSWNGNYQ